MSTKSNETMHEMKEKQFEKAQDLAVKMMHVIYEADPQLEIADVAIDLLQEIVSFMLMSQQLCAIELTVENAESIIRSYFVGD